MTVESRLPPGIEPLPRPTAIGPGVEPAFLRWESRHLAPTERFWRDFSLFLVSSSADRVIAGCTGLAPCIAIVFKGPRDRFVGLAFRRSDAADRDRAVHDPGARRLAPETLPGGGPGIELAHP